MYLMCFPGKGADRRGEVGVFFQELSNLRLVGVSQK